MGLPRSFELPPGELEKRFRDLSWQMHPDRFAGAGAGERRLALEKTTALNDAYRTLRDPVRRAAHLLELHGVTIDENRPGAVKVSPELLEEILELREALADAKGAGNAAAVGALLGAVREKRAAAMAALADQLGALPGPVPLAAATEALARIRYYDRFLEEASTDAETR